MGVLHSLNWFDIALALVIVVSTVAGLRTGFARVVVGLIATVIGFMLGFWCYRLVAVKLLPIVHNESAANILGFLTIFCAVALAGALLAALLSSIFKWVGLSWFNYLLGGAAGLVRGALLVAVMANILVAFAPSPTPAFLQQSAVLPYANQVASVLAQLAPQELKDSFEQQMQNLKQFRADHSKAASSNNAEVRRVC
jgi:membrane protein required for colicin V production